MASAQHAESARRPDGMPVGVPFQPGNRANPGGASEYERTLRAAIQGQETADKVCAVIAAMREDAMAHEKFSPAAAKVYLQAVGVNLNATPVKVDLSDAPEDVMTYLRGKIH